MALSSCVLSRTTLDMLSPRECRFNMVRHLANFVKTDLSRRWKSKHLCCFNAADTKKRDTGLQSTVHQRCYHHHHKPHSECVGSPAISHIHDRCHLSPSLSIGSFPFFPHCRPRPVRQYSTTQEDSSKPSSASPHPHELVFEEMSTLSSDIRKELSTEELQLRAMSHYYFDGKGKTFRPMVALLMSKTCNIHNNLGDSVSGSQRIVAMVTEMIHTASLVHDDVIDASDTRRGQSSLNKLHGQRQNMKMLQDSCAVLRFTFGGDWSFSEAISAKKPILVGDFILSRASIALSRTRNTQVITILSSVIEDLVSGEFMQLGSKENENERFAHYLKKTYMKTASLIANTCKSVAVLAQSEEDMVEKAFQYGRNLGIAFQLIDDLLDFVSCESVMGKPTAADLKLGLATAPVLFAAQEFPELHPMIMRRFSGSGDVERARALVAKSNGVEQTRLLATQHSKEAIKNMQQFTTSDTQQALIRLATILLDRKH